MEEEGEHGTDTDYVVVPISLNFPVATDFENVFLFYDASSSKVQRDFFFSRL